MSSSGDPYRPIRDAPGYLGVRWPHGLDHRREWACRGGKTTLVKALVASIEQAVAVHFDDHPIDLPSSPLDWLQAGADFNEWGYQGLVDELTTLRSQGAVVVVEAPLGRAQRASGELIDFLVFIDTPLEVALARWVRRRLSEACGPMRLLPTSIYMKRCFARSTSNSVARLSPKPTSSLTVLAIQPGG